MRSESVAHVEGTKFIASDEFTGDVNVIDARDGYLGHVVKAPPGRIAFGLATNGELIFVAGGWYPTPSLYVYSYGRNDIPDIAACHFKPPAFLNDVVADKDFAYFTDSWNAVVYRLRLGSLPACDVDVISLPDKWFRQDYPRRNLESDPAHGILKGVPIVRSNGIVLYNGGLIVGNSLLGAIFFVDFSSANEHGGGEGGTVVTPIVPFGATAHADGMDIVQSEQHGTLLFIAQPRSYQVSVWRLHAAGRLVSAELVNVFKDPNFQTPTSVAVGGGFMLVTNFDFSAGPVYPPKEIFTMNIFPLV